MLPCVGACSLWPRVSGTSTRRRRGALAHFDRLPVCLHDANPSIGGEAVLAARERHDANAADEMQRPQGDGRHGQHDRRVTGKVN